MGKKMESVRAKLRTSFEDYKTYVKYYSKFPKEGITDFFNYTMDKFKKLRAAFKSIGTDAKKDTDEKKDKKKEGGGVGAFAVAKGMAIYNAGVGLLTSGLGALREQMPFIFQGLDMAGKVISANLIYPLAKELMPLFQQMFSWVRNNRIVFVQLGTILVSLFRIVFSVARSVLNLLETGWNSLWKSIAGGGKATLKGFIDYMNFLMLKIAFLFAFLEILLTPILKGIGATIGWLWKNVVEPFIMGFWEGFKSQVLPMAEEFNMMIEELALLFKDFKADGDFSWIGDTFRFLGKTLGFAVIAPLRILIALVRFLATVFINPKKAIIDLGKTLWDVFSNNAVADLFKRGWENAVNWVIGKFNSFKEWLKGIGTWFSNIFSGAWDAISSKFESFVSKIKEFFEPLKGLLDRISGDSSFSGEGARKIPGFASGGTFPANNPIIVGEKGPELMIPGTSGRIISNEKLRPALQASGGGGQAQEIIYKDERQMHFEIKATDPLAAANEIMAIIKAQKPEFNLKQAYKNSNLKTA
ncbi:hypothetical protein [Leptospira andrefontaineae]|nr:hypothetical protein [Leptospira andrefontaineae]